MSTIINILKNLDNSSSSISRQTDPQNIKNIIKKRNEKLRKVFKINSLITISILTILIIFFIYFFPKSKNIVIKDPLMDIKIKSKTKVESFINELNKKKINSNVFIKKIEQESSLIKLKNKQVNTKKSKNIEQDWNVYLELTGIIKYGNLNERKACINSKWVKEGDFINGILIKKIGTNSIIIKKNNKEKIITLN